MVDVVNQQYRKLNTGWASTTTIYNERIGYNSYISLVPASSAAQLDDLPSGAISDSTSQYITTASPFAFNTQDSSNGVYLSSNKMYFRNAGEYNIQFSIQFANTNTAIQEAIVWLRKNGSGSISGTASKFSVPNKHGSVDGYIIAVANFFITVAANDYIELMWNASAYANLAGTTTGIYAEAYGASSPVPSVPSVVMTAQFNHASASTNIYVSSQQKGQATLTHFANNTADKTYRYLIVG
jgi:hypothetical protein